MFFNIWLMIWYSKVDFTAGHLFSLFTIFWWSMFNFLKGTIIIHYEFKRFLKMNLIFCFSVSIKLQNSWFFKSGSGKKSFKSVTNLKNICFPIKVGINFQVFSATWKYTNIISITYFTHISPQKNIAQVWVYQFWFIFNGYLW